MTRQLAAAETAARLRISGPFCLQGSMTVVSFLFIKGSLAATEAAADRPLVVEIPHFSRDFCVLSRLRDSCSLPPKQPRPGISSSCSTTKVGVTSANSSHLEVMCRELPKPPPTIAPPCAVLRKNRRPQLSPRSGWCLLLAAETTHGWPICPWIHPRPELCPLPLARVPSAVAEATANSTHTTAAHTSPRPPASPSPVRDLDNRSCPSRRHDSENALDLTTFTHQHPSPTHHKQPPKRSSLAQPK